MEKHDTNIKSIQVFSTGVGSIRKEHRYGSSIPLLAWVLFSRSWIEIPINVFVIQHPQGLILFDAGVDPAIQNLSTYVDSPAIRFLMKRLFRLRIQPQDTLSHHLARLGFKASQVLKVIISHLHFDHVGGIGEVPWADLVVSRNEWDQLRKPHPEREFLFKKHVEHPENRWCPVDFQAGDDPRFQMFDGYFDVLGDGSMILLPTPGHTTGSVSLLAFREGKAPVLLVGDLVYEGSMLQNGPRTQLGDQEQILSSCAKIRALQEKLPDLLILPSHDWKVKEVLRS